MRQKGQLSNEKNRFFISAESRAEDERNGGAIHRSTVCQLFKPICKSNILFRFRRSSDYWLRCSGQVFMCMHTHKTIIYTPQERRKKNIQHKIFFYLFALAQILLATSHVTSKHVNRTQPRINIIFFYERKQIFFSSSTNNMNNNKTDELSDNHEMHITARVNFDEKHAFTFSNTIQKILLRRFFLVL